jgi:hypothetical protein
MPLMYVVVVCELLSGAVECECLSPVHVMGVHPKVHRYHSRFTLLNACDMMEKRTGSSTPCISCCQSDAQVPCKGGIDVVVCLMSPMMWLCAINAFNVSK